jgi:hypothetical protein
VVTVLSQYSAVQ